MYARTRGSGPACVRVHVPARTTGMCTRASRRTAASSHQPGKPGQDNSDAWIEALTWFRPIEYIVYFMIYVFAVGKLGYLLSTLIFCPAIAWRSGYRSRKNLITAAAFGFVVVLFFKTFLQIKIPGGEIYNWLPAAMRNFMIINF